VFVEYQKKKVLKMNRLMAANLPIFDEKTQRLFRVLPPGRLFLLKYGSFYIGSQKIYLPLQGVFISFRGQKSPILLLISRMITAEKIYGLIEKDLGEKGFFLVDIQVKSTGKIVVYADSFRGLTLDDCVSITRLMESKIGQDLDAYELEVSSPGLDNPLKLPVQYQKNTGRPLRVVKTSGETIEGRIKEADNVKFTLETFPKNKPGKTKPENQLKNIEIAYAAVRTAKIIIR
jgi:ribosome maturation factor RimP